MAEKLAKGVLFDSSNHPIQQKFVMDVMSTIYDGNSTPYRDFFYGGGIRGGKTSACMAIVHMAATRFPEMRIHIVRATSTALTTTTEPSFLRFCNMDVIKRKYNRGSELFYEYKNGSRVYFFPESFDKDPDLNRFKGLETNLVMLEQVEELQEATYQKAIERVGSWAIDPMPTPVIVSTLNPSPGWLREKIYEPHKAGTLLPPKYYLRALPTDNPYVTDEQLANYQRLSEVQRKRFVEGDWDARELSNIFLSSFDREKHLSTEIGYDNRYALWLSFDFNVTPMTCIAAQAGHDFIHVIDEYRMDNTDISTFVNKVIKPRLPKDADVFVTGDPSGGNRQGTSNTTYYILIRDILNLPKNRIQPAAALMHEASRNLCNTLLERFPSILVHPKCEDLLRDIYNVRIGTDGKIEGSQYSHKTETKYSMGHFLDTFRYLLNKLQPNFIKF